MFTILLHLLNYENSALSDADTTNTWGQKHYRTHSLLDCHQNPKSSITDQTSGYECLIYITTCHLQEDLWSFHIKKLQMGWLKQIWPEWICHQMDSWPHRVQTKTVPNVAHGGREWHAANSKIINYHLCTTYILYNYLIIFESLNVWERK
jgi:hypothetical protein